MQTQAVPITDKFENIYKTPSKYSGLYAQLSEAFQKAYSKKPTHYARAPGRVNLIGEHIDYMGYGVFPFALEQDCIMAFSVEKGQSSIKLAHIDGKEYPSFEYPVDPSENPHFTNNYQKYVWAGYRAAVKEAGLKQYVGINIMMVGQVPIAAGCSSSSALVVVAGIVSLIANSLNATIQPEQFIENLIKNERAIGTSCGGMDQTCSVLGKLDKALYIQFNPIRAEPIQLPSGLKFVICNSLTQSAKMLTLSSRYNMRVCECRMALKMLLKKLGVPPEVSKNWNALASL